MCALGMDFMETAGGADFSICFSPTVEANVNTGLKAGGGCLHANACAYEQSRFPVCTQAGGSYAGERLQHGAGRSVMTPLQAGLCVIGREPTVVP